MAASTNARSARIRKFVTRRGVELQFTELGFGGAPLGNLYRPTTEKEARVMLEAVWASGCRYFDTAPLYGLGLSETRLNGLLRPKPRASYLISTKVGRLLDLSKPSERSQQGVFFETPSRRERYDYSHDGVMRSLEFSLERLGLDQVDIVFGHDVDVITHGSKEAADARIKEFVPQGVNLWWETLREPNFDRTVGLLAKEGRMVVMAGREARPQFPVGPFYVKGCSLFGFAMFNASAETQRAAATDINRWHAAGQLKANIDRVLPLSEAAAAHRLQEENTIGKAGTLTGKIVLVP